jgi:hypothetical protein
MSQTISQVKYFLLYILHAERKQAFKVLYYCVGEKECKALTEICANILHKSLNLEEVHIRRHKKILTQLSKVKVHCQSKEKYIKLKYKDIYTILHSIKNDLLELL